RRNLRSEGDWIGLQPDDPVGSADLELVVRALLKVRNEQLPDPGGAEHAHRVQAAVPAVEVADQRDTARRGRPDGERDARDAVELTNVRAQLVVKLLMTSLGGKPEVG